MENNLPEGWEVVRLVDYIEMVPTGVKEYRGKKKYFSTGSIQANGIESEGVFEFINRPSRANRIVDSGDVLQARMRNTDKGILIDKSLNGQLFSTGFLQLKAPASLYLNKLLYYYVKSDYFLTQKNNLATGSTQEALTDNKAKLLTIPLPPLPEQHRIVQRLDALMEKVNCNKERLQRIPGILKRFRQSVLAAALSGKLIHSDKEWTEVELETLIPKGGIFDGPFGSNLKTADYCSGGVRVIRLENIGHLKFIGEKETFITVEKYQNLLRHTVKEGDIIFSSFITDEIRVCILPKFDTDVIAKADCFCIRPSENKVNRFFLLLTLASYKSYSQLVQNIHGATRPRINTSQLKRLKISLPPVDEQLKIVRRVEELFAFADLIESQYLKVRARLDKLPQTILAQAFRGELVPQNPNDEPAGVLLQRIIKEKTNNTKVEKGRVPA